MDIDGNGIANDHGDVVGLNSMHVVTATIAGDPAELDGLVITAGDAVGGGVDDSELLGAGVYIDTASVVLRDCLLAGNDATGDGGAIFAFDSSVELNGCAIESNRSGDDGGGIYAWLATVEMNRCSLRGNLALDRGGACYLTDAVRREDRQKRRQVIFS